jgi:hypothetical protein
MTERARCRRRQGLAAALAVLALAATLGGPGLAAAECLPIADFSQDPPGSFPRGWRVERDEGRAVYRVFAEDGRPFLRALARGVAPHAALEREWDLAEYPVLAWRWRPRVFPEGSDERRASTNDSALGVYVGFPRSVVAVRSVKYVWSRAAPVGAQARASAGFTRILVLRTGKVEGGRWVEERVRVADDYRRLFGAEPARPRGIGVLTDSDDTRSVAEGDYADFRLCRP